MKGGVYTFTNNSKEDLALAMPASVDKGQPYELEVTLKLVRGSSVTFASHYSGKQDAMKGIKIDKRGVGPVQFTGGRSGSWANAGAYTRRLKRTGKPLVLRVRGEKYRQGSYNKLRLIYAINGQVVGKDDYASESPKVALVVSPGSSIEVHSYVERGTALKKKVASRLTMGTTASIRAGDKSKATFKAGDTIFGTVFMPKPFVQIAGRGTRVKITEAVYVAGKQVSTYSWTPNARGVARQGKRYDMGFAPAVKKVKYPTEAYQLSKRLAALPAGVHNIKLLVRFQPMNQRMVTDLASAEFKFDNRNAKGRKAFAKMAAGYRNAALAKTKMPKSKMNNPSLSKNIAKMIKKAGWKQKVLKVVLMSREWGVLKHRTFGTVLQRKLNVGVATRNRKGECMIFYPTIFQKRLHGNKFAKATTLGGIHKLEEPIACKNIK